MVRRHGLQAREDPGAQATLIRIARASWRRWWWPARWLTRGAGMPCPRPRGGEEMRCSSPGIGSRFIASSPMAVGSWPAMPIPWRRWRSDDEVAREDGCRDEKEVGLPLPGGSGYHGSATRCHRMKITDFLIMDGAGEEIPADAFGNNVAFLCEECGHPVLATALENQRGSDEEHPATCRGCGTSYFLDVRSHAEKLYIHTLPRVL